MSKRAALLGFMACGAVALGAASAQDVTPLEPEAPASVEAPMEPASDETVAAAYRFDDCVRPQEPVLATDEKSRGRVTLAAEKRAVRQYNAHVEEANAYMRCIADEAQRDLDAYYQAVTAALEAEQASVMSDLGVMRDKLKARR